MTNNEPSDKFRRLIHSEEETHAEPPSQPERARGPIPASSQPALDKDNMPLPRRVTETDLGGTRVTPAAYETKTSPNRITTPPVRSPYRATSPGVNRLARFGNWGCLIRVLIVAVFILVIIGLCIGSATLWRWPKRSA